MPAEKLTPWFDWPVKPVRVGWYDIRFRQLSEGAPTEEYEDVGRFNWNGARFVSATGFSFRLIPGDQWRGLAWTRELPTKPGTYAWRDDWNGDDAVGTLLVVLECQGRFVAGEAFGNGSHQCLSCLDPIADYEGGEFLGPLPE